MERGEIRIGTSGWSYPSGAGTWNGLFYPAAASQAAGRRFDELAFYSEYFDTVEVNSTFYRQPDAATSRRWVERTPAGFEFSVKLYQQLTHVHSVGGDRPPGAVERPGGDAVVPARRQEAVAAFRAGIDPLASAGKLGAVLAQFPPGFHDGPEARDYLRWLLGALTGYQLACELRHRTWSDRGDETAALLAESGAAWVQIDEPKFRSSIRQDFSSNTPGCYYMRLHGRNAASWWHPKRPEERYNYLYSAEELAPIARAAASARAGVGKAYVYMNNHFSAKSVVNATVLKRLLDIPIVGEFSPELVETYPELAAIVKLRRPGPPGQLPWDTSD